MNPTVKLEESPLDIDHMPGILLGTKTTERKVGKEDVKMLTIVSSAYEVSAFTLCNLETVENMSVFYLCRWGGQAHNCHCKDPTRRDRSTTFRSLFLMSALLRQSLLCFCCYTA